MTQSDTGKAAEKGARMRFWGNGFAVTINVTDWSDLEQKIAARLQAQQGFSLATLNLDHLVKLRREPGFRAAYATHDYVVADGNPIVWLSKLARRPVSLIPGSDAILPLVRLATAHGKTLAFVGSTDPSLTAAKTYLEREVPGARIVATIAPEMGFDPLGCRARAVLEALEDAKADVVLIGLGAPKQEQFAAFGRDRLGHVGFISIGAGLDFLSGTQYRAPHWMRRLALEWLWRCVVQPRRMIPRYVKCAAILPKEVMHALRLRRVPRTRPGDCTEP